MTEEKTKDSWYQKTWRPATAGVYLLLCVIDYVIRPLINSAIQKNFSLVDVVSEIINLDPSVQVQILETMSSMGTIPPILHEYVHLSFAAILGGAAWTRGQEKINRIKVGEYE